MVWYAPRPRWRAGTGATVRARTPRRHLFVAAGVSFFSFVFLLSILPRSPAAEKSGLTKEHLRKTIADLRGGVACVLNDVRLPLGEHTVWGFGKSDTGGPASCSICRCIVQSPDAAAVPECFIHGCPSGACSPGNDEYEPEHPCCKICDPPPEKPETNEPEKPSEIDPVVPLTGDIYPSSFRHEPAGLCQGPTPPSAVLAVTSAPRSAERRALFRRLYRDEAAARGIQLVFLLGRHATVERAFNDFTDEDFEFVYPEMEAEVRGEREAQAREDEAHFDEWQLAVDAEAEAFGDVIQSEVAEHYFHLGLKTLSLLDVVRRRCPRLRFVAKTDDDVAVTVHRLAEAVAALNATRAIYGSLRAADAVSRDHAGWFTSEREWPWPVFPSFVLGPGYLISGDAAGDIYRRALRTRYHHLEDVFITGIVAEAAGVTRHDWPGLCGNPWLGVNVCRLSRCVFTHKTDYDRWGLALEEIVNASRRFDANKLCMPNVTRLEIDH